jgi:hypothetical protein
MTEAPVSPLRRRMIEDMTIRKFAPRTQEGFSQRFLIPPLVAHIRAEERLLRSQFGREYEVYRSRTSRLIPGWIRNRPKSDTRSGVDG